MLLCFCQQHSGFSSEFWGKGELKIGSTVCSDMSESRCTNNDTPCKANVTIIYGSYLCLGSPSGPEGVLHVNRSTASMKWADLREQISQSILLLSHYYFMGQQPPCPYSTEVMQLLFGLQTSDTVQEYKRLFHGNRNAVVKIPGAQVGSPEWGSLPSLSHSGCSEDRNSDSFPQN